MQAFSHTRRRAAIVGGVCAAVLFAACSTVPQSAPKERGPFRAADLVELVKVDPTIHLDVRYATSNNFTGRPVYRQARAFLQRPAAEALVPDMPSTYDEFTDRAAPSYTGGTAEQRARRDLLRAEMEKEGFAVDTGEWWHFNFEGWETWPILDIPFEQIP